MIRLIENRWFALVDLVLVVSAGIGWVLVPQLGWRLLPLALLPWAFRLAAGRFPFKHTQFDLLLLVFLLTAVLGVWAAYNREAALAKFWLLVAGILLFYALARQPKANLWLIAGLISVFGVGVAVTFLLTQDWQTNPAKINLVQKLAVWWMDARPGLMSGQIHHNTAGGMMAITVPFSFSLGLKAWREKSILVALWVFFAGVLLGVGLLFTTSRGAWIGLAVGMGVWLLWMLSRLIASRLHRDAYPLFCIGLTVSCILVLGFMGIFPGGMMGLAGELPGPDSAASRLVLAQNGAKLLADFFFTGGGLSSFSGLYSRYILDIPFFYFDYSHNLLLDIGIEQGFLGLLAFGSIYLSVIWMGIRSLRNSSAFPLILASLSGIVVIFVHGLVDNVVYYQWGALLAFVIPGFLLSTIQSDANQNIINEEKNHQEETSSHTRRPSWRMVGIGGTVTVTVVLAIVGLAYRPTISSTWHANLGSVEMARIELADFPTGQWDEGSRIALLEPAEEYFLRALELYPINRTAQHRLGLIALQRRDFPTAISYLEAAYRTDKDHRGIHKSLGYAYAWSGEFDLAYQLLTQIPEARQEMSTYVWWWQGQGRNDLADNAATMLEQLNERNS
jgi:O-antigen ligase